MRIDPPLAEALLARVRVDKQRPLDMGTVLTYARTMEAGAWRGKGTPIELDADGWVSNGQHRLLAVVLSGTTQRFRLRRGGC